MHPFLYLKKNRMCLSYTSLLFVIALEYAIGGEENILHLSRTLPTTAILFYIRVIPAFDMDMCSSGAHPGVCT